MRRVVWFSCGAASAVLAKLAKPDEIVYCDTLAEEHPDNRRFLDDVSAWCQQPITVIKSQRYTSISDVFQRTRYMAGIAGARCTVEMKKLPREAWQRETDVHLFGYTAEEVKRAERFEKQNPSLHVEWPLIELGISKKDTLRLLAEAHIELPAMYALGFEHNNCIGCVKSTSAGYWNLVRRQFPDTFALRARQSRLLGVRLVRWRGVRIFLDELPATADAPQDDIDCGPVCQSPVTEE